MRLKTFFFPIVVVIAISIFFFSILPQIKKVNELKRSLTSREADLNSIQEKQRAIDKVGDQLMDSGGKEAAVKKYLPETKVEERIISSVNFLAGDANVSLVDISMGGQRNIPTTVPNQGVASDQSGQGVGNLTQPLRKNTVEIELVGDYEKIRVFLEGLEHMPIFNTVQSLEIAKQEVEAGGESNGANNNLLAVNVIVDFGYQDAPGKIVGQIGEFEPELDDNAIDVLQKYVSLKSQSSEEVGAKGKTNPFVLN